MDKYMKILFELSSYVKTSAEIIDGYHASMVKVTTYAQSNYEHYAEQLESLNRKSESLGFYAYYPKLETKILDEKEKERVFESDNLDLKEIFKKCYTKTISQSNPALPHHIQSRLVAQQMLWSLHVMAMPTNDNVFNYSSRNKCKLNIKDHNANNIIFNFINDNNNTNSTSNIIGDIIFNGTNNNNNNNNNNKLWTTLSEEDDSYESINTQVRGKLINITNTLNNTNILNGATSFNAATVNVTVNSTITTFAVTINNDNIVSNNINRSNTSNSKENMNNDNYNIYINNNVLVFFKSLLDDINAIRMDFLSEIKSYFYFAVDSLEWVNVFPVTNESITKLIVRFKDPGMFRHHLLKLKEIYEQITIEYLESINKLTRSAKVTKVMKKKSFVTLLLSCFLIPGVLTSRHDFHCTRVYRDFSFTYFHLVYDH
eukprot:Pgem_evm1s13849